MTRTEIEALGLCDWFNLPCPSCDGPCSAYQGTTLKAPDPQKVGDYALLCDNAACEHFGEVALVDDMATEIDSEDWVDLTTVST